MNNFITKINFQLFDAILVKVALTLIALFLLWASHYLISFVFKKIMKARDKNYLFLKAL